MLQLYWKFLLLTSFFFFLPAIQYVFFQLNSRHDGTSNLDTHFWAGGK